jgi:cell wall-associated NlpC family hydrolase
MSSIAYLLILIGVILIRQVSKGRASDLPGDLSDSFLALVRGDTSGLTAVLARTGTDNTAAEATVSGTIANTVDQAKALAAQNDLAKAAIELGSKAVGYGWSMDGPSRYDCSGLMYRALQKVGYKGPRFYTATLLSQKGMMKTLNPTYGDMVLWLPGQGGPTGHVGVITGDDQFYSARSIKSGIGYSKISTFRKSQPTYVRFVKE